MRSSSAAWILVCYRIWVELLHNAMMPVRGNATVKQHVPGA